MELGKRAVGYICLLERAGAHRWAATGGYELASNTISMRLIAVHGDDLLRLAGWLKLGVVRAAL
jgi:hypothetical protein